MKQSDLLHIISPNGKQLSIELRRANHFLKLGQWEKAAKKFALIGKKLVLEKEFNIALDYFEKAFSFYKKGGKYIKSANILALICDCARINNDRKSYAQTLFRLGTIYENKLNDYQTAGQYYYSSAKEYEAIDNLHDAFKKAKVSYLCFEKIDKIFLYRQALKTTVTAAYRSGYYNRAGEALHRLFETYQNEYTKEFYNLCVWGPRIFNETEYPEEALVFLRELIAGHFEKGINQASIVDHLIGAIRANIVKSQLLELDYFEKLILLLKNKPLLLASKIHEISQFCETLGLKSLADEVFVIKIDIQRRKSTGINRIRSFILLLWWATSRYGTSLKRWMFCSMFIILLFGVIFAGYPCPSFLPSFLKNILTWIKPNFNIHSINNEFTPYYFSIVTFTTLGFGDVTPGNLSAQVWVSIEVLIGYVMLGGLISIFSRRLLR